MALVECNQCCGLIAPNAAVCPHCGNVFKSYDLFSFLWDVAKLGAYLFVLLVAFFWWTGNF